MFAKIKSLYNSVVNYLATKLAFVQAKAIVYFAPSIQSVFRKAGAPKATFKDYVKVVAAAFAFFTYLVFISLAVQISVYAITMVLSIVLAFWLANLIACVLTLAFLFDLISRASDIAHLTLGLFKFADKMEAELNAAA